MGKKIKRQKTSEPMVDPLLEEVDEDRSFEIEVDDETNEIILVHHYRRKWNDDFDADIEHCLNMDEAGALVGALVSLMGEIENKIKSEMLIEKITPKPIEGNPMQGPNNIEGK